jgi:CHAD domain-containing protein
MVLDPDHMLKPVKKLRKLIDRVEGESGPETVHKLPTTTRRFEAIFKALSLDTQGINKRTLKDLGRIRKRAGKVRDIDVLIGFASNIHPKGAEECCIELLESTRSERRRRPGCPTKQNFTDRYGRLEESRLGDRKTTQGKRNSDNGSEVSIEAMTSAVRLVVQLGTPPRLSRETLHPYWLKIKELQNLLRMAADSARPRFVEDLGEVKDAIGEWHDWEELSMHRGKESRLQIGTRAAGGVKTYRQRKVRACPRDFSTAQEDLPRNADSAGKRGSAAAVKVPRPPVWEATSLLAG